MLPECRSQEYLFSVPKFDVTSRDVKSFMDELKCFHDEFRDCFLRSETRDNVFQYMVGQFSELERKSIEPIAINVQNAKVRPIQRTISDAIWDEDKICRKLRSMINDDMGDPHGVLILDESCFVKKGNDSAGVARQYCGNVGKVDNCQVGVFSAYASPGGYAFLDKRLFIPEAWFSDDFEDRREKCRFPKDLEFKTKPELAAEMLLSIHDEGIIPYKYIVADSVYGHSPAFIGAAEKLTGKTYFVSIASDTLCWPQKPVTKQKRYKYKGETRSREVLSDGEKAPMKVQEIADSLNNYFWYRRKVSEGTKGPVEYEFSKRRVVLAKDGLPWKTVWLIMKRTIGGNPIYSFYISNALGSVRLPVFVWLSGMRWAIEQCFEEAKTELGMAQYEVRKFPGWNHHMLTIMLAHFFLWHLKIRLGEKSACNYCIAA